MKKKYKNKAIEDSTEVVETKKAPKKVYMFPHTPLGPLKVEATSRVEAEKELLNLIGKNK